VPEPSPATAGHASRSSDAGGTLTRPPAITVLAIIHFITAGLALLTAIACLYLARTGTDSGDDGSIALIVAVIALAGAAVTGVCAIGLWTLRPYGRVVQIALAALGLIAIPIGTLLGGLLLAYLFKPGVKVLFARRPGDELTVAESAAIATDANGGLAIAVMVMLLAGPVLTLPIMAAVAIPGLLRARMSANEATAIGAVRSVFSAQTTFAAECGEGRYASSLESLGTPAPSAPDAFLLPDLATDPAERSGYRVTLTPGDTIAGAAAACNGTPVVDDFFVHAAPIEPGTTGGRFFGINAEGTLLESREPIPVTMSGAPGVTP
jgi:type IV pilus assembly protein PilA